MSTSREEMGLRGQGKGVTGITIGLNKWYVLRRGKFGVTCSVPYNRTKKITNSVRTVVSVRS